MRHRAYCDTHLRQELRRCHCELVSGAAVIFLASVSAMEGVSHLISHGQELVHVELAAIAGRDYMHRSAAATSRNARSVATGTFRTPSTSHP